MPANIRRHSLLVAEVATLLARELGAAGLALDVELVEAAALLHDLGKATSLATGEDHAELGAAMVIELGYPRLAPILREHTLLDAERLALGLNESLLVNYADKRVRHDELVSLTERLEDLADRYARTSDQRALLRRFLELYLRLEVEVFARLPFSPAELGARMEIAPRPLGRRPF